MNTGPFCPAEGRGDGLAVHSAEPCYSTGRAAVNCCGVIDDHRLRERRGRIVSVCCAESQFDNSSIE
jgi:hypothetical protein